MCDFVKRRTKAEFLTLFRNVTKTRFCITLICHLGLCYMKPRLRDITSVDSYGLLSLSSSHGSHYKKPDLVLIVLDRSLEMVMWCVLTREHTNKHTQVWLCRC